VTGGERRYNRLSSKHYARPYGAFRANAGEGPTISLSPNIGPRLHKFKQWVNIVDEVIKWPHPEQNRVEKSIQTVYDIHKWEIPQLKDKSYEMHLRVFKEKLLFWDMYLEGRPSFMPPIEVARRCIYLGHEFPKYIKDLIEESLRDKTGLDRDLIYDLSDEKAWGHDYFFSPRDCLNYQIPDDLADIKRVLTKPPDIPEDDLNLIESYFRRFITAPSHRVDLDDVDYLEMFSNQSSFVGNDKQRRRTTKYEAFIGKKLTPDEQFKFDYCFVQKNAAEGRAAIVASPGTLLMIKKFHKMFKAVAHCPEDKYYDPNVTKGLERWLTSNNPRVGYIMSDIKKSGLTFNRNLFNRLIKVLHETMPSWGWDSYYNYGNATICIPQLSKDPIPLLNGFGLGVMDLVVSFTQACIFNIFLDTVDLRSYDLQAKFWSDDSIIRAKLIVGEELDLDQLYELMQTYNGIASRYGIVVHDKKPYVSKLGVFLESYGHPWRVKWDSQKCGQYIGCLFDVLKCPDIFRAKEVFATLLLDVPKGLIPWATTAQEIIVSWWGYEFHPREIEMPFECGGWSYVLDEGWNTFFHSIQELPEDESILRLTRLCLTSPPRKRRLKVHKDNESYISSLIHMGWDDDPAAHNWKIIASSALLNDYKSSRDTAAIEKNILNKRQECWKRADPSLKHNTTEYGDILEFWARVKHLGWYLPPTSSLRKVKFPFGKIQGDKSVVDYIPKLDRMRAWLFLTRKRGSIVSTIDPSFEYTDASSVCSALLRVVSHSNHVRIRDCIFAIENNYDLESLMKKLEAMMGPVSLDEYGDQSHEIEGLIRECMNTSKGNFVFPLGDTPFSILTDLEEYTSMLNKPYASKLAAAVILASPELNYSNWDYPTDIYSHLEELSSIEIRYRQSSRSADPITLKEVNTPSNVAYQNITYLRNMMIGAMRGQSLDISGANANSDRIVPDFAAETIDALDDDDFDMGDMFG